MATKKATHDTMDETDEILASMGSRVTPMASYESNVIREATLRSAPMLTGVGFPDLGPLGPSYDSRRGISNGGTMDVPTVRTVLARVRSELRKHDSNNSHESSSSHALLVLRVKEQMLLSYLQNVARLSPEDMPVDLAREEKLERKRSRQLIAMEDDDASVDPSNADDDAASSSDAPVRKKRAVSRPMTAEDRLEAVKQDGTLARSVISASVTSSFGKQALAERERTRASARSRSSMMSQKKLAAADEIDEEQVKRKELLRRKRKERQELRRKRREQWVEDDQSESSEDERELTFDDDPEVDSEGGLAPDQDETLSPPPTEQDMTDSSETMKCPLCSASVRVESSENGDAVLSQHIDACQRVGRRVRRQQSVKDDEMVTKKSVLEGLSQKKRRNSLSKPRRQRASYVPSRPSLDDLHEADYEDRVDDWIESGVARMRDMAERDENESPPGTVVFDGGLVIPAWVNNRLFSYQRTGLRWLWELHTQEAGGIVGDEMGLGKTVQVCSFLGAMALGRKVSSILIVCPATMLQHWLSELSTWAPGLRRVLIHQSGEVDGMSRTISPKLLRTLDKWLRRARADRVNEPIDEEDLENMDEDSFCGTGYVVITTFENVRRSPDIWTAHNWGYCVLDEGQKIRNPDADVTLACKRLRTPHRLLLSGTPIQNDLRELWSLMDFVFPGRLGTLPAFEAEFADPIRRGGYSNASPMQVQLAYRCAIALRDLINPYMLRRQKRDIKEVSRMPGKTEHVLFCRLSSRQRGLYEAYIQSDAVRDLFRGSTQLLSAVTVLRKICNHPDLVCDPDEASFQRFVRDGFAPGQNVDPELSELDDDDEDLEYGESLVERAGKLEVLAKILPLWRKQGHRVLIFCQWRRMLNIIQKFVQAQGWKFGRLDGNTNVASRQRLVDSFNSDDSYFFMLMTTRTGGIGLNLTGASRVILYDPDWNPQLDAQARERSWRFGQKNPVTVYRLITSGTIEEKIYQRQIFKTALTNKVLQDPRQRRLFSQRDLRDFFTLKADAGSLAAGGDGLTETGELTRGSGVVDPDEAANVVSSDGDDAQRENLDTLQTVMKSKGLAGVFDHDVVEGARSTTNARQREMEEKAKSIATQAARALRESAAASEAFQPTWTGSDETRGSRFGGGKFGSKTSTQFGSTAFGGAGSAGIGGTKAMSSSGLLANLKKRNDPKDDTTSMTHNDLTQYSELLRRIRAYVRRHGGHRAGGGPTTEELLGEFDNVPNCDAAIFRRLLNSIASVQNGRWRLKP